jgi:hypothetical protein
MNAPLLPERLLRPAVDDAQAALPLAAAGVQRTVWHGRFGSMLIEVSQGAIYVNGQRVEPHEAPAQPAPPA